MDPTHRLLSLGGVIAALLVAAGLTARPVLLVAATTLLAGVVILQWQAITQFSATQERLTIGVTAAEQRILPDSSLPITSTVTLSEPVLTPLSVTLSYGAAIAHANETLTLAPGETEAQVTHDVTFPVVGRFELPEMTCTVTDASGVFTETFGVDASVTVTVEPAEPTDVHVGQQGERIAGQYGEHQAATTGSGVEVAELREYQPGDSVGKIDWKATARLNEPYVRESEAETARRLSLLVDARDPIWEGNRGRSKFAYLREVALGFIELAESAGDPLSLSIIDENGIRFQRTDAETTQYQQLRWTLQDLTAAHTTLTETTDTATRGPADAADIAQQLSNRNSAFATTLRPYVTDPGSYIERLADDALFAAVRQLADDQFKNGWTVLFTDDTDPNRVIEAAKIAVKNGDIVTVFITPSTLFSPRENQAQPPDYDTYVEFEAFRRDLDGIPGVVAYEVAPGDRMEAVLAAGRQRSAQGEQQV